MYKSALLEYFGSLSAIAAALGITLQAVSQWDSLVPELTAYKVESVTRGKLKVDSNLYAKGSARAQMLAGHAS